MATIETVYVGELRTQATHVRSGNQLITDAPLDNHGKGEAFSPTDLLATALGSCMLTVMGIAAEKYEADLTGTTCSITKIMAEKLVLSGNPKSLVLRTNFFGNSNGTNDGG